MKKISTKFFILDKNEISKPKENVKFILNSAKAFYYKLRMNMIRVESIPKQYKVSVCAIFKNEAPYLREWIEFNHIVGVDHFFLYNNNSEDNYEEIIEPYVKKGIVTLIQWPKNQAQMECYNDCIFKYSKVVIQIMVGGLCYAGLSYLTRNKEFSYILNVGMKHFKKA